jgi:hypothetical protein
MSKYHYDFCFVDKSHLTFNTDEDINFHAISNTAIAFPEIYINMANVKYIMKKENMNDSVSGNDSSKSQDKKEQSENHQEQKDRLIDGGTE